MFKWGLKLKLLKQIRYNPRGNIYSIAYQNNDYKSIEVKLLRVKTTPKSTPIRGIFHKKVQAYPQFPRSRNVANF